MNASASIRRAGSCALIALVAGAGIALAAPAARAMTIARVVSPLGIEAWLVREKSLPLVTLYGLGNILGAGSNPRGRRLF